MIIPNEDCREPCRVPIYFFSHRPLSPIKVSSMMLFGNQSNTAEYQKMSCSSIPHTTPIVHKENLRQDNFAKMGNTSDEVLTEKGTSRCCPSLSLCHTLSLLPQSVL